MKEVPTVGIDYFWMGEKNEEIGMPTIGGMDEESGSLIADVVPEKGRNAHAVKRLGERIDELGYRKIILKLDDEPAIVALKAAAKMEGRAEVIMEESPVGDSPSNGLAEGAVKIIQGLVRTIAEATAGRYEEKVPRESPTYPWMVRHAAASYNRYAVGTDGKTAHMRLKGKRFTKEVVEFGEFLHYLKLNSKGQDKYLSRWGRGVWLGILERSGEVLIGTADGIVKARTVRRHADYERCGMRRSFSPYEEHHGSQSQARATTK